MRFLKSGDCSSVAWESLVQPAALSSASHGGVLYDPPHPPGPGVAALRSALERVVPEHAKEVLDQLLKLLGSSDSGPGITPAGWASARGGPGDARAVVQVLNLKGFDEEVLAAFDKPVWRSLDALARQRGMVLPLPGDLPDGVEIRGISGRPYDRDSVAFLRELKSLASRQVAVLRDTKAVQERTDSEETDVSGIEFESHSDVVDANLNGQAEFSDGSGPVWCRHLAADWIIRRRAHLAAQARPSQQAEGKFQAPAGSGDSPGKRFSNVSLSSPGLIAANLASSVKDFLENSLFGTRTERSIVHLSAFTDFLHKQFEGMEIGQYRHYLLAVQGHVMSVELRCKPDGVGGPRYVMSLYDPNRTVTSRRVEFNALGSVRCDLQEMLPGVAFESYFGKRPEDRAGLFIHVEDWMGQLDAKAGDKQAGDKRVISYYPGRNRALGCAPAEHWYRVFSGDGEDIHRFLESQVLLKSSSSAENLCRLEGRSNPQTPSTLLVARQEGHSYLVEQLLRAASNALADGRLTSEDYQRFLLGGQEPSPS